MATLDETHGDGAQTRAQLAEIVHAARQALMPSGCARTQAFRATLSMSGANDWPRCMPRPAQGTHIRDSYFRAWLAFYARTHTRPLRLTSCPRLKCCTPLDAHGDHFARCACSAACEFSLIIRRHDQLVRELALALSSACRRAKVEPRALTRRAHSRPDVLASNERGEVDVLDVALTHTFCDAECARAAQQTQLKNTYNSKLYQHRAYATLHDALIVPLVFAVPGA